jgi:hypothetical protein
VLRLSRRKLVASLFAGIILGVTVPFAGADAGGGAGSNHGCPGHQPPPPPSGGCGDSRRFQATEPSVGTLLGFVAGIRKT